MKYFTNGTLSDPSLSGVTIAAFQTDADGNLPSGTYTGYLAQEITEAEYLIWVDRITNPDNVTYFHGAFGAMGVVDATTHALIEAKVAATLAATEAQRRATRAVKRVQALVALNRRGITKIDIYGIIGAMPSAQQAEATLWFEESLTFVRNNPYINGIGSALGLSQADLDDLFYEAEAIQ